jgi:glycosyltransferase involved in cell wall biosynthesis
VVNQGAHDQEIWTRALSDCDIAICTVHPPREGFHCSVFAARCIKQAALKTHLIPKTGTIVPEYLRAFYLPDESIRSSVIAIADFTRRYLIETYKIPPEMVALIYQGVDIERFLRSEQADREAIARYPLPENASPILGCIGSFEHRKGLPVMLKALKLLTAGPLPEAHIMLVGDGPDEQALKQEVESLALKDHVSFFPFTSEPNLVFPRLDITALPSLYKEGLPNVLQESMAMEVPVVSSKLGGVPEVVIEGETGYMVEPGDEERLADAVHKLWVDQNRYRRMQKNARDLIAEKFNKTMQFERFVAHFRELVG